MHGDPLGWNDPDPKTTDCGLPYAHAPHVYLTTKHGKAKACDGSTTKRGDDK